MSKPLYIPGASTSGWLVHGYVDDDEHLNINITCFEGENVHEISEDKSAGDHEVTLRFTHDGIERRHRENHS